MGDTGLRSHRGGSREKRGLGMIALLLLTTTAACDEVSDVIGSEDPCDREGACEVDGVGFVFDELSTDAYYAEDMNRAVASSGSSVEVTYDIRNRGDETSGRRELQLGLAGALSTTGRTVDIEPLEPGESQRSSIEIVIPEDRAGDRDLRAQIRGARTSKDLGLRVEDPDLQASLEALESEVRVAEEVTAVVGVSNEAYVTEAPSSRTEVCLLEPRRDRCREGRDWDRLETPALAPGEEWSDTIQVHLPTADLADPAESEQWEMMATANVNERFPEMNSENNSSKDSFVALPNLPEACPIEGHLEVGDRTTGTLDPSACDLSSQRDVTLYEIDLSEGEEYAVTLEKPEDLTFHLKVISNLGTVLEDGREYRGDEISFGVTPHEAGQHFIGVTVSGEASNEGFSLEVGPK